MSGNGTLSHVTFSGNSMDGTDGDQIHHTSGTVTYSGSIISGGDECGGSGITSGGYSALATADTQCAAVGTDMVGGAIGLALAPASNGGPIVGGTGGSQIRSLGISSPSTALDLEPSGSCAGAEGLDQRGVGRPIGAGCDAGAFEAACTTPAALPGCPALPAGPTPTPTPAPSAGSTPTPSASAGSTGLRAAALKKCKKKKGAARKKCKQKALKLPV